MKRRIGVALAAVSAIFVVYLTCFLGHPVRLLEISVSKEQFGEIVESRHVSDITLIDGIFFNDQQLIYDAAADTFYYSMVEGMRDAYNPYVEKKTTYGNDVSLAVLDAQITDEDIRASKRFHMIAYNDDVYSEYSIVCTTLPLMNLECDEDIGEEKLFVHMTLFDNSKGAAQRFTESDGNISIRGRSSRTYPKKGYKLSLTQKSLAENIRQNKVSLLGMRQDDDWILYAAYNDQEKVRNVFSSNLWKYTCAGDNELGIDNGMEYRYLELFVNNQYWGLYALGYPIDERQLDIDMASGEHLYKKGTWDTEDRILSCPTDAVDGYETTEDGGSEWEPLKRYYATLHSQWDSPQEMYAGIDIDNAIDMYLFINLIQGIDHIGAIDSLSIKNMFISFHNRDGKETVLYTPWDMDVTWGQRWTGDMEMNMIEPYGIKSSQNTIMGLGNLPALTMDGDDKIWELILDKYKELRQGAWSEDSLNIMLDELEADIYLSGAYARDRERWPNGNYQDADRGLDDFRHYVVKRLGETDAYYARVEEAVLDGRTKNVYITRSLQYKGFLKSNFILMFEDKEFLQKDDYREFLEYIGVDIGKIKDGTDVVVINGEEKKTEYFDTLSVAGGIDTCIGFMRIQKDTESDQNFIYVNDAIWCKIDESLPIKLAFGEGEEDVSWFDFTREYVMWSRAVEQGDADIWRRELEKNNYDLLIEIVNHDIIKEKRFQRLLEEFGVNVENISVNTDFIAVKGIGEDVTVLEKSHDSGTRCITALGELSVFYNDEGDYGVYMNGNECMLVHSDGNDNVDVRAAVINNSPYKVVWCPTFTYEILQ